MVETYHYDSNAHNDAVDDIAAADTAIRGELDACNSMAMAHLEEWKSKMSREQYDLHKAAWDKAFTAMQDVLNKAKPTLINIKENYEAHDRNVQQTFV